MIGVGERPSIRGHESKDETTSTNLGWIAEASILEEPSAPICHRQGKTVRRDLCVRCWVTGNPIAMAATRLIITGDEKSKRSYHE